jgi:hypothetical protein
MFQVKVVLMGLVVSGEIYEGEAEVRNPGLEVKVATTAR